MPNCLAPLSTRFGPVGTQLLVVEAALWPLLKRPFRRSQHGLDSQMLCVLSSLKRPKSDVLSSFSPTAADVLIFLRLCG